MKINEFEKKILDMKIEGLRILCFRLYKGNVKRCLAKKGVSLYAWDWDGKCMSIDFPGLEILSDDEIVERYQYSTFIYAWKRCNMYDIKM